MSAENSAYTNLLPAEMHGWKAAEDARFDDTTIFDYINGAGEVYKAYKFRELFARRLEKEHAPDIVVDVFDMGSAANAFGVFTHDLEGEEAAVGQGATYKAGLLSFWKDRFFVSIYTVKETAAAKEAIFALGKHIASAITTEGRKPALTELVPQGFSRPGHIRYFYSHFILNTHFFVAVDNILLLGSDTEAVLAPGDAGEVRLVLIRYPDDTRAAAARTSFHAAYMPDAEESGIIQTEDGLWTATALQKNLLVAVFQASSESAAQEILARVMQKNKSP